MPVSFPVGLPSESVRGCEITNLTQGSPFHQLHLSGVVRSTTSLFEGEEVQSLPPTIPFFRRKFNAFCWKYSCLAKTKLSDGSQCIFRFLLEIQLFG